ncbi:hypothetical protein T265_07720 [Opisthorchis viverrini]|uniref:Uncharacterized protein n=1 Tax=Opisthorchis viverrini TaxID=6198 RepID=A0A075AAV3_OPIVI|nr:hypothetical protein T265_07720 [Opisthorchis viverrini]KER24674.1 hypothetical protein T265_07720 [Opisthorchis viverrini]
MSEENLSYYVQHSLPNSTSWSGPIQPTLQKCQTQPELDDPRAYNTRRSWARSKRISLGCLEWRTSNPGPNRSSRSKSGGRRKSVGCETSYLPESEVAQSAGEFTGFQLYRTCRSKASLGADALLRRLRMRSLVKDRRSRSKTGEDLQSACSMQRSCSTPRPCHLSESCEEWQDQNAVFKSRSCGSHLNSTKQSVLSLKSAPEMVSSSTTRDAIVLEPDFFQLPPRDKGLSWRILSDKSFVVRPKYDARHEHTSEYTKRLVVEHGNLSFKGNLIVDVDYNRSNSRDGRRSTRLAELRTRYFIPPTSNHIVNITSQTDPMPTPYGTCPCFTHTDALPGRPRSSCDSQLYRPQSQPSCVCTDPAIHRYPPENRFPTHWSSTLPMSPSYVLNPAHMSIPTSGHVISDYHEPNLLRHCSAVVGARYPHGFVAEHSPHYPHTHHGQSTRHSGVIYAAPNQPVPSYAPNYPPAGCGQHQPGKFFLACFC